MTTATASPLQKLNTGFTYNSDGEKAVPRGQLYMGLFHGRWHPSEQLRDWGTVGNIFGPFKKVIIEGFKTISLIDMDGQSHTLEVREDMVSLDGYFYGDWTFFTKSEKSLPYPGHDNLPIAAYPFNGDMPADLTPAAIHVIAQNTEAKGPLFQNALIGPLSFLHTTYLYHMRAGTGSPECVDLNYDNTDLVDNKFNRLELFIPE